MIGRSGFFTVTVLWFAFFQLGFAAFAAADENDPDAYESFPHLIPEINDFTGAAHQRMPISVPPGRNGIQPELHFSYNSFKQNQWLGIGWRVPIDAVARRTKDGTHYDRDDFALLSQGKKIDLVSLGGDRFKARIETDFSQYFFHRAHNYWEVTRKDGTKRYFGMQAGANARQTNAHGTFLWGLDRVEDTNGNYMNVHYLLDQGVIYPDYIEYTGNQHTGDQPYNSVHFAYEPSGSSSVSYISRVRTVAALRLRAVKTFAYGSRGIPVLEYRMEYQPSPAGGRSRLQKIRLIGNDGRTELPGYAFTYKNGQMGSFAINASTTDLLTGPQFYLRDLNGDNIADMVFTNRAKSSIRVFWGNGDGSFQQPPVESTVMSNAPYPLK